MTRTYERETVQWDRADIEALVEAGRAQYFPGLPGYVIDKKHPVRNHQIVDSAPVEVVVPSPIDGYSAKENYDLEDRGPGGVVYDNAVRIATDYLSAIRDRKTDVLVIVRSILDDEDGEYTNSLNETIYDVRHANKATEAQYKAQEARTGVYIPAPDSADEDALLAKFGV